MKGREAREEEEGGGGEGRGEMFDFQCLRKT